MKPLKTDHPRTRALDALSGEEIRFYLKEFLFNPDYGWSEHPAALERAFGMANPRKQWLKTKLKGAWIYPSEQMRFTKVIRDILAGVLVPKLLPDPRTGRMVWSAARVENPVAIRVMPKGSWKVDVSSGRLSFTRASMRFLPQTPAFDQFLTNPTPWVPKGMR